MTPQTSTERVVTDLLRFTKRVQVELDTLDPQSERAKDIKDCLKDIEYYSEFLLAIELELFDTWQSDCFIL